jgi:hypothetical protein
MRLVNQALLARQTWRLLDRPDSLCSRLMKAKYYRHGSLIDMVFTNAASPGWRAIEYGPEHLKKGIIRRIGDGESVRVWRDPWLPRDASRRPLSEKGVCRYTRVADFLLPDRTWNVERVHQFVIPADVDVILGIRPSRRQENDFVVWHPTKDGVFSVRSAYHLAVEDHLRARSNITCVHKVARRAAQDQGETDLS